MIQDSLTFFAFRYALSRMTYVVDDMVEHLTEHWDELSKGTQKTIQGEIREAIRDDIAGMEMDIKNWKKILELKIK